jgi:hypothetical protein
LQFAKPEYRKKILGFFQRYLRGNGEHVNDANPCD